MGGALSSSCMHAEDDAQRDKAELGQRAHVRTAAWSSRDWNGALFRALMRAG